MYIYSFKAKIYPDGLDLSSEDPIVMKLTQDVFGINGEISIYFKNSDINIEYKTTKIYSETNTGEIETLKNFTEDVVRIIIDTFCFTKSYYYDMYISEFELKSEGFKYKFLPRGEWNITKDDKTASEETIKILSKLYEGNKNSSLALVFADFRMSIKYPKMTASFCFKAIETIRKNFFDDDWEKMRNDLGLERGNFEEIEKFSKANRHGDYPAIQFLERERIMNFTRSIIEKLLTLIR